jgi:hypothetical protein
MVRNNLSVVEKGHRQSNEDFPKEETVSVRQSSGAGSEELELGGPMNFTVYIIAERGGQYVALEGGDAVRVTK